LKRKMAVPQSLGRVVQTFPLKKGETAMSTRYTKRRGYDKRAVRKWRKRQTGKAREIQLTLNPDEVVGMIRDSLTDFATEMGLKVARVLLEDEVSQRCGERYQRSSERTVTRYGHQRGVVVIGGQKLPVQRPRIRYTQRCGEAELENYACLQSPEAMPQSVLKRLVRGVSCRDYEGVVDLAREGFGVKKSSVSRSFVKASAKEVQALAERRFDGVRFPVIYIDGTSYAGQTMVAALGITEDGTKRLLGVRQGATENAAVCTALLEDLCGRGLDTSSPTLLVLDGAKALHVAAKRVWGRNALIQRCQVHKKRNVREHLPQKHWEELSRQLNAAYHETDYDQALKGLKTTARWLDRLNPDAAASLREGMEETLTVVRLGVPELLRQTLATTNPIESAFSVAENVTRRVKRWREGDMRQRWCIAGLMRAESKFRRIKGHRHMPQLLRALERVVMSKGLDENRRTA
jgi:putative transposase